MVSITGITAEQARHYYTEKDNYYLKDQGKWFGKGADSLGLRGEVNKEDFDQILAGHDPKTGEELIHAGGEARSHRAGTDLTFSAQKSVSLMGEGCRDDRVSVAHDRAVEVALRYIEDYFSQARQTENRQTERVDTGNLLIAKFQHDTSRELDPQLHTHCVVMNITRREDGQWRALSNEELYNNKMMIGQIYRNELAANLKELGYGIVSDHRGLFEIRGIDNDLIEHFSQRSQQIKERVKELKESGKYKNLDESKLKEIATLGSRVTKQDIDITLVRKSWTDRMQALGHSIKSIQEATDKAAVEARALERERTEPRLNEYDYIRIATKDITENESIFSKEEVLRNAGRLSVGEYRNKDLERAFNELKQDKEIKQLKKNIFTSAEMRKIEKDIVQKVRNGHGKTEAITTTEKVQERLKDYENIKRQGNTCYRLSEGQKKAVKHILTSSDRYIGIQGDAGTGKSTMLDAVREQAEREGYKVRGFAKTGKAADEIENNAGIKSQTIDSFLELNQQFEGSGRNNIWIVDEASMMGSRQTHKIVIRAEKEDARIVFIGDTKQLQTIEAGPIFQKLQEIGAMKTSLMKETIRQTDPGYKSIVDDVSRMQIDRAFQKLDANNKITEIRDRTDRLATIIKEYTHRKDCSKTIIITARNADRNELNSKIRVELKKLNKLSGEGHTFTVRESKNLSSNDRHFAQSYTAGDIVFTRQAGIAGRAGNISKIVNVDHNNHVISLQDQDKTLHVVDLKKNGHYLSTFIEKELSFSPNDRVVFLKNDQALRVKNGQLGEIKNLDHAGNLKVKLDNGNEVNFNVRRQYPYVDHGYAVTDYKSQGQTAKNVIYHADTSKGVNYNQAYVAVSRGKEKLNIYTDNKETLREQMKVLQIKTSTLDHVRFPVVNPGVLASKIALSAMKKIYASIHADNKTVGHEAMTDGHQKQNSEIEKQYNER